jgi:hypothetical protein
MNRGAATNRSVVCEHCHVAFKYPELYEDHLRADKSCPDVITVHQLHILPPAHEGQERIMQLDTIIPVRIEMKAVWRGGELRWQTVSVISDASRSTQ